MYNEATAYVDHKKTWSKERLIQNGNEMLAEYDIAQEYAGAHGFRIYNATRGGQLEAFPRVDFDEVIKSTKGKKKK